MEVERRNEVGGGDGVKNHEGDKGDERDRIFTTMGSHPFNNIRGVKCAD